MTKKCAKCQEIKNLSHFGQCLREKDGLQIRCKSCRKIDSANYYKKHQNKRKEQHKLNPEKNHNNKLLKRYGITLTQYKNQLFNQKFVCAICNQPEKAIDKRSGKIRNLSVDHDHITGKNRDLLCSGCNITLGHIKDDVGILESMKQYLMRHYGDSN